MKEDPQTTLHTLRQKRENQFTELLEAKKAAKTAGWFSKERKEAKGKGEKLIKQIFLLQGEIKKISEHIPKNKLGDEQIIISTLINDANNKKKNTPRMERMVLNLKIQTYGQELGTINRALVA
jgi:hypothetical protein